MDFPVSAQFAETANASQLHDEARGGSAEWPASFIETPDGWVYRVDERDGVTVDQAAVQAALDGHAPQPPVDPQAEFIAAIDAASTLAELKAVLKGEGLPAQAQARGKPEHAGQ